LTLYKTKHYHQKKLHTSQVNKHLVLEIKINNKNKLNVINNHFIIQVARKRIILMVKIYKCIHQIDQKKVLTNNKI
jgi:hypothetical protein